MMGQGVLTSSEQCNREVGVNVECGHEMALEIVCPSGAFRIQKWYPLGWGSISYLVNWIASPRSRMKRLEHSLLSV